RWVIYGAIGCQRHAEQLARLSCGVVAAPHISRHQTYVARPRIAVAASTWRHNLYAVAGAERDVLVLGQVLRHQGLTFPMHADHVGRAVTAAQHARWPEAAVVHDEGGARLAAQQLHLVVHAEAAALRPGPAGALAQGE